MIQKAFLFFVVISVIFGVFLVSFILGRVAREFKTFVINRKNI